MNESYYLLKKQFYRKLNEYITEKGNAILAGNCTDLVSYKSETSRIIGAQEAYSLFLDTLKEISAQDFDEDDQEDY